MQILFTNQSKLGVGISGKGVDAPEVLSSTNSSALQPTAAYAAG